ncbi:MAG: cytidylate kinase [Balneola sp.]|nr:cytidylate kinase [Balneola sp.]
MIVVIDGPAGSGKSSTARAVAHELNIQYLDSGALYRAVTYLFLESEQSLPKFFESLYSVQLTFKFDNEFHVSLNGEVITEAIRDPKISLHVSGIAAMTKVREFINAIMKKAVQHGLYIADGRDLGTAVFPNAKCKFFMTADLETRAKRRRQELDSKGIQVSYSEVVAEIKRRDQIDSTREEDPLKQADDAILVDSSAFSFDEQVQYIVKKIKESIILE